MNQQRILIAFGLILVFSLKLSSQEKSLVDFFLPMEIRSPLVSEGIWGAENILPRDTANGLEDATLKNWCYWDGKIVKGDDEKYYIHASRWSQSFPHGRGWKEDSKGILAVSDNIMGPYEDKGILWPQWKNGKSSNAMGLKMHNGKYAVVTSEITSGEVFIADSPKGPFELLGQIQVDLNGFDPGLARYQPSNEGAKKAGCVGHMSNVRIILRHDSKYMIVPRSTAIMISDNGILGPYKIVHDRVYKNYPDLPQSKNEDPTVWYSGGIYHIVYNHWPSKTSHHFTSENGIDDWKYRGIAFKKGETDIFRYSDGTINKWEFIERMTAYVENGHVTHFIFSVLDVHKGKDLANDNHGSKIVVVPFDGKAFDKYMNEIVKKEK
jgi:hypothetical protein